MAKKKTATKRPTRSAPRTASVQAVSAIPGDVVVMTIVFTLLCIVFAVMSYWHYYQYTQ